MSTELSHRHLCKDCLSSCQAKTNLTRFDLTTLIRSFPDSLTLFLNTIDSHVGPTGNQVLLSALRLAGQGTSPTQTMPLVCRIKMTG